MQQEMFFDGVTYNHERDNERLTGQQQRVYDIMSDEQWHTISEVADKARGSEPGVSASIRNLRKQRFGGHNVERQYVGNGLYQYRLHINKG